MNQHRFIYERAPPEAVAVQGCAECFQQAVQNKSCAKKLERSNDARGIFCGRFYLRKRSII